MQSLGARLKQAREQRGFTQDQLSEASGVRQSDISKLERGDSLTTTALPALARALRCDINWLDTGEGDPDFGNVLRGWPFPGIERERFARLQPEERLEIQGVVRKMLSDFEAGKTAGAGGLRAVPQAPELDTPHPGEVVRKPPTSRKAKPGRAA